jgi:hypothetical protein
MAVQQYARVLLSNCFEEITRNVVQEVVSRNENYLRLTEAVKIQLWQVVPVNKKIEIRIF